MRMSFYSHSSKHKFLTNEKKKKKKKTYIYICMAHPQVCF